MQRIKHISEEYRRRNPKKFKKKSDITFVGIHNRRGDHIVLQKQIGSKTLEAGYFLEAMDMYRAQYKRVVFLYVSDDIEWARTKLGKCSFFIRINIYLICFSSQNFQQRLLYCQLSCG